MQLHANMLGQSLGVDISELEDHDHKAAKKASCNRNVANNHNLANIGERYPPVINSNMRNKQIELLGQKRSQRK